MHPIQISDNDFKQKVLDSKEPVLVDFWAEWCGPCKMIAPILEELATTMNGKIIIAKLNVDDNPRTAKDYGIRGIPTLMIFKNGQVASTKVGALTKSKLVEWVDSLIS
ncbi:MAG: thioredoxin TrxA [Alphaproteobacteria bacterium]|nr:thioredoxin TrxA [Alphaproteobacteria bacterium]